MAHIRLPEADKAESECFRLEALVPDSMAAFPMTRHNWEHFVSEVMRRTPQAAVLYPDGEPTSTLHRGDQPKNGAKLVFHYMPPVVVNLGAENFYTMDALHLVMMADFVRIQVPGQPDVFIKDRLGWDEEEPAPRRRLPMVVALAAVIGGIDI